MPAHLGEFTGLTWQPKWILLFTQKHEAGWSQGPCAGPLPCPCPERLLSHRVHVDQGVFHSQQVQEQVEQVVPWMTLHRALLPRLLTPDSLSTSDHFTLWCLQLTSEILFFIFSQRFSSDTEHRHGKNHLKNDSLASCLQQLFRLLRWMELILCEIHLLLCTSSMDAL